jgi:homoprotocatechuate degradation regulator HpaR
VAAQSKIGLTKYSVSLAGTLLGAREAVMAPIRPFLRAVNVTEQQWRVLRVLADVDALDASGVAEQALLYPPTVTRILREMADRGLILRRNDPKDGRRSIISISDEGYKLVQETAGHTKVLLAAYTKAFGEKRLNDFMAEAHALAEALEPFQPDR